MANLNEMESAVLLICYQNALNETGGDFGFTDNVIRMAGAELGLSDAQAKGYISALKKKGELFTTYFEDNGAGDGYQTSFPPDVHDAVSAAYGADDQKVALRSIVRKRGGVFAAEEPSEVKELRARIAELMAERAELISEREVLKLRLDTVRRALEG